MTMKYCKGVEHEEQVWNRCYTAESLAAQRFPAVFRGVWNCGTKNTAYIREKK